MKSFILATAFILLFFTTVPSLSSEKGTESESKCISCHTSLKDLMRLCWKIEKMRPKQAASEETSGDG
ncbi:MAG: hypothetical protein K8R67_19010 [Desulfobacteraceae bacterium]|nr:hypothetical protein [Desulfobacteraceae bacterium]